jgi:hypothetical protein
MEPFMKSCQSSGSKNWPEFGKFVREFNLFQVPVVSAGGHVVDMSFAGEYDKPATGNFSGNNLVGVFCNWVRQFH